MVILNSLLLTNFKSYSHLELNFSPKINAFVGMNGVGKTNILDAIHYLSMCKSNFHGSDKPSIRKGEEFFRIQGYFIVKALDFGVNAQGPVNLESIACAYTIQERAKKTVFREGKAYTKLSEHIGRFPLIFIAPDDTQLLTEGSSGRRQFLDQCLCQLDNTYLQKLITYNKVLEQRNALLKQGIFAAQQDELLLIYAQQLAEAGAYIFTQRKALAAELIENFQSYYTQIVLGLNVVDNSNIEAVHIQYESILQGATTNDNLEDFLYQAFVQALAKDKLAQRTTIGIQQDDLACFIDEQPVKQAASQGQRKSYLLALKLAEYDIFRKKNAKKLPILLLDDLFDKLDAERVNNLTSIINQESFGQIFLTDTNAQRIEDLLRKNNQSLKIFSVAPNHVQAL